jgi:beta-aspartyl-peptidase (threonine type)
MNRLILFLLALVIEHIFSKFTLVVHGGAGVWVRSEISKKKETEIKYSILESLLAGYKVLKNGGGHLDAAERAIMVLEDNPLFTAGRGSKINQNFQVELDAGFMDGTNLKCGSIAASKTIKNPIKGARYVMENTEHVLITGEGIDSLAEVAGLETVNNSYFITFERLIEYINYKKAKKLGTVGAVINHNSKLAALTSTGGFNNKMAGRVGDTPIIGAGTYANDETCAISCTGHGETMIRHVIAYDIHARIKYKNITLKQSLSEVFGNLSEDIGGIIAIDKDGNVEMPFNTEGMARGYVREDGKAFVYIFNEGEDYTPVEYQFN